LKIAYLVINAVIRFYRTTESIKAKVFNQYVRYYKGFLKLSNNLPSRQSIYANQRDFL